MRRIQALRWAAMVACALAVAGCGYFGKAPSGGGESGANGGASPTAAAADAIPADQLTAVLAAHFDGVGAMEQYRYAAAAEAFRKVRTLAPGWTPGKINLAIALLNDVGVKSEKAKTQGGEASKDNFAEAIEILSDVLKADETNLSARYCRGVILQYLGDIGAAHADFQAVVNRDPSDGHAWFRMGATLPDPDKPDFKAGLKQAPQLVEIYENALKRSPYLVPAYYNLFQATVWAAAQAKTTEERLALEKKRDDLLKTFQQLNPQENPVGVGERGGNVYGEMGKHARLLGPEAPRSAVATKGEGGASPPKFAEAKVLDIALGNGEIWALPAHFVGEDAPLGALRERFGPASAACDLDGDGRLDLYLAGAVKGVDGLRDALLLNRGDGKFEDATAAFGLPLERASVGVAAGDFDADRFIDLYLTGLDGNLLLRNVGGKAFEDVTEAAGVRQFGALSLTARWLDLDQDGDLDLYVVNLTDANDVDALRQPDATLKGRANAAFRNDGRPSTTNPSIPVKNVTPIATATDEQPGEGGLSIAFTPWPDADGLLGAAPHTGIAALDIDDDRDIDLVLTADDRPPIVVLNERLGHFRALEADTLDLPKRLSGLLVTDLDRDGRADLVAVAAKGPAAARRNAVTKQPDGSLKLSFEAVPLDAKNWRTAIAADLDLDGNADLVGLPSEPAAATDLRRGGVEWARPGAGPAEPLRLPGMASPWAVDFVLADLDGDPLPDVLRLGERSGPTLSTNLGNGRHWLAIDLSGRWKFSFDHMRTNPHGLGAMLALEGKGLFVPFHNTTPSSGLGQSIAPVVLGMGSSPSAALLHLTWPDGVMQAELNVAGNQKLVLAEYNRKTGSCPVLFTWNGRKYECLGDFLGGGGLGYLVAPGVYSQPDRDEAVLIGPDQLQAERGTYRLRILEPMDEVAYLDKLTLEVIDAPPGVTVAPDERFAPGGNRPTGELLAWREIVRPERATDLDGHDVSAKLRDFDRNTVDDFRRFRGWIGYAEEHGIVLDFGDRLAKFGPNDRLVLGLAGWVEYPYSQTNYAASTAGVPLQPPVLERLQDDGSWAVIESDPGYPAGLPRLTTLDLTGELGGPRCVLRLRTNMECYWDQAFLAVVREEEPIRATTLAPKVANLGYRGFVREVSPDGKPPLLYDYDQVDPAPLARFRGLLTRHGDVNELLSEDDDRLCLVGPGDELALEFDAWDLPDLPEGWTRRFVLRSIGYCKDADPFTAGSDEVGPLPWKAMPEFPFAKGVERPVDPAYRRYLDAYQTRPAGVAGRD